ncbi:MAG TPA: hypothetical protein VMT47_10225 [Polyangia bacterium]|nr:hypothetical protein [Polyangia bacterium]
MIRARRLGLGTATLIILGATSVAHAEYQAPPSYDAAPPHYASSSLIAPPRPGMYRHGFVIGVGLGLGVIWGQHCLDDCRPATSFEFHLGGMLNPRTALVGDFWLNVL